MGQDNKSQPRMESNLFRYVWQHTKRDQIWILCIVVLSMPTYFLFFDLPKQIVNGPIQGRGFETEGATQRFLELSFGVPTWVAADGRLDIFSGFEMERLGYLTVISVVFLLLVCVNGLFKFFINTFKGRLGEQTLRRLRYELVDRLMRFPTAQVRKMKGPEAATMVKDEIEPLGAFIGDAFVQPVFVGGQAITAMVFILIQNVWLGLIALFIVVVQAMLIPRLRHRLLVLNKERQLVARELAGRVGEIVDGAAEIHANDASNYERADISHRLGRIFLIRYELFQRKFFVKFLNNFLSQVTPFMFYFVGGYFAITGSLDIGQLIAVITAYKDLPAPIRDLINWDQRRLDVQIKYTQVIIQFTSDELLSREKQAVATDGVSPLDGDASVKNLNVIDETGAQLVDRASFKLQEGQRTAVIGEVNSGAEPTSEALAGLIEPTGGSIHYGSINLADLPESVSGRRLGYVSQDPYLRQGSVRDNLLYSLRHAPVREAAYEDDGKRQRARYIADARLAGNSDLDLNADWLDLAAAGVADEQELNARLYNVLEKIELAEDLFNLGLRGHVDPLEKKELATKIIDARRALRERLKRSDLAQLVEPFHPDAYSDQATIAENLLFGTAIGSDFAHQNLAANSYLLSVLAETGLDQELFAMGQEIAKTVIELFSDLPPDHPLFEQLTFMEADDIPDYEAVLARVAGQEHRQASIEDRALLLKLPFAYVEPQNRLSLLGDELKEKLLSARQTFRDGLPENLQEAIEFYEPDRYNAASTLQDNILLGRVAYGIADATERVTQEILTVLDEQGLRPDVFNVGLDFNAGTAGKRLTLLQRQKIGLARAILKRPDYLIINKIFAALDAQRQLQMVDAVLELAETGDKNKRPGVFWVLANPELAAKFDQVLVFEHGRLLQQDTPGELAKQDGLYSKLVKQG